MIILRMAWRNLWRKPVRTGITLAMILFAVVLSAIMASLQQGVWDNMIDTVIRAQTGLIQVQRDDYWEERSLDHGFLSGDSLRLALDGIEDVSGIAGRLDNVMLGAAGDRSRALAVFTVAAGDDTQHEFLRGCLVEGALPAGDGCLPGSRLADYLELERGDTLVLLGQGWRGAMAAGVFPVTGIADLRNPELDGRAVYISLEAAQRLNAAPGLTTALVVHPGNARDMERVATVLESRLGERWSVMTWTEMLPEIAQGRQADTAGGILMLIILYLLIAFGILGTVLMMTLERRYEFGVLVAVGMKRMRLAAVVVLEGLLLAAAGTGLGLGLAFPVVGFLARHPIPLPEDLAEAYESYGFEGVIVFSTNPDIFFAQAIVVGIIAVLVSIYPIYFIARLRPVEAMHA